MCVLQVQTDISVDTKQQTLPGVAFPMHGDAMDALLRFRSKELNYVQLVRTPGFTCETWTTSQVSMGIVLISS